MDSKTFILKFINSRSDFTNWYKIHRKFSGDPETTLHLEHLSEIIDELEKEGLIKQEHVPGEIPRLRITERGKLVAESLK
jgi:DNA-binding HxlR family transcriptional regulator